MPLTKTVTDYLTSGRFIHDNLVAYVDELAEIYREMALRGVELKPVLLFWLKKKIRTDDGKVIGDKVVMELNDLTDVAKHIRCGVERTRAYAVLLFSPEPDCLTLELETPLGAESWTLERQRRGDSYFVKPPERSSSKRVFGVIPSSLD